MLAYDKAAHDTIVTALRQNPEPLIQWAVERLATLGSWCEWSMDDNYATTEGLAALSDVYGLPPAYNQGAESLDFYQAASRAIKDQEERA